MWISNLMSQEAPVIGTLIGNHMEYLCNKGVYGKGVIIGIGALITKCTVEGERLVN